MTFISEAIKIVIAIHFIGADGEPLPDENAPLSGNDEGTICDLRTQLQTGLVVLPPERPPKPAHLGNTLILIYP